MGDKFMFISKDDTQNYTIKISGWNIWQSNLMNQPFKVPKVVKPTIKKTLL